jgi:hypothetical protein
MHDAMQGEPIARAVRELKDKGRTGAEPRGSPWRCGVQTPARSKARRKPIETLGCRLVSERFLRRSHSLAKHVRGDRAKSWSRFPRANPEGAKAQGSTQRLVR